MRSLVTMLVAAVVLFPLTASADDHSGPICNEVWTEAGNPHNIVGDIWVEQDCSLRIMPRVEIYFYGYWKFSVLNNAVLYAVGTKQDSILITTPFPQAGWHGIRFLSANDASQISYCRIEYGKALGDGDDRNGGAIFINRCSPTISHNHIDTCFAEDNGGAIYCDSSNATISENSITRNWTNGGNGGGIYCRYSNNVIITGNDIVSNGPNTTYFGGGIAVNNCFNPTISGNTIAGNWAHQSGGGIYCYNSGGTISDNAITANQTWQRRGGGIACDNSSPQIKKNRIIRNWTQYNTPDGGGIACLNSSNPVITGNVISENQANSHGGGIFIASSSNPTITDNSIEGNHAVNYGGGILSETPNPIIQCNFIITNSSNHGGGIYFLNSSPNLVQRNVIAENSASSNGGGIHCNGSNPSIINNTITDNWAGSKGGGLYCYNASPEVRNTILWCDSASTGNEIWLEGTSAPIVRYCDIKGGWPGGNLDCDPEFVNPAYGNYHLQMTSCCIDAGDPDPQYNDPDGTRNDIGAFYFRQEPPATVELMPHTNCIILPPEGGTIYYDAWIYNLTDTNIFVDIWAYAYVPGIGQYGPIHSYDNVRVTPWNDIGRNNLSKSVPAIAPAGEYSLVAYIAPHTPYFEVEIVDTSYFTFTKLGTPGGKDLGWLGRGDWFDVEEFAFERQTIVPTHSALMQNYPNPFNAKTTINYQLPATSDVKLDIYNLLGERVATLVDETQQAGYRSVIWDASQVSSGLYFYKLTAGDFAETKRMMLVK